jgi:hypothetical protein
VVPVTRRRYLGVALIVLCVVFGTTAAGLSVPDLSNGDGADPDPTVVAGAETETTAATPTHHDETSEETPHDPATTTAAPSDDEAGHGGHGSGGMAMEMRMVENGTVINENVETAPPGCEAIQGEREITIRAGREYAEPGEMFAYDQESFTFEPCTRVTVTLVNEDEVRHQWMVHGLPHETYPMGMFNIEVYGPASVTATFVTPAQQVENVHCSLPQHEQKGMLAEIRIEEDGEAGGENATG